MEQPEIICQMFRAPDMLRAAPLRQNSVQIWLMDITSPVFAEMNALLSENELAYIRRFRQESDRLARRAVRVFMRLAAGNICGIPPASVCFCRGAYGKPMLDCAEGLEFSISHSGSYAAAALSRGKPVGIDIEKLLPIADYRAVGKRFFTAAEADAVQDLRAFYRIWTAKEAYVKLTGKGLYADIAAIDVCSAPKVLDGTHPTAVQIYSYMPAEDYICSLAY